MNEGTGRSPQGRVENINGPGSFPFIAGATWFGRSAVAITEGLGEDIETLRSEAAQRLTNLSSSNPTHSTAERAMWLEHTHKRFLQDVDHAVITRRKQMRQIYESVIDHPCGNDRAFERLNARMPMTSTLP